MGVRDKEGYELLRAEGIRLGEHPYDFYTLETAEDVTAIHEFLKGHRDSTGRSACMGMNFVMANLDFEKISQGGLKDISLMPLTDGLPGNWKREGLFEAYRSGIKDGVFFPSLHGLTHFCQIAVEHALAKDNSQSHLLRTLWRAETPYIYWRMPWVGYEYNNPEKPRQGFLSAESQSNAIKDAAAIFKKLFSCPAYSACAPGYRANSDTHRVWAEHGIHVVQNGSGSPLPPHMDDYEMLHLHRTIDIEPSQRDLPVEKYVQLAESCFARGVPAIISVHAINFHSSLKDFRGPTLSLLDEFLTALEKKFPNLLYVHDLDAYDIVNRGKFRSTRGTVSVTVQSLDTGELSK
ncbi:MAG TPA: hypothetical protein VGN39_03880 [Terriglobales bacterium]|nr:hypothetical protein [Terriglobales bacterium]